MYWRIVNQLDAKFLKKELKQSKEDLISIADRIMEITSILDENYGSHRSAYAYGGYILFFTDYEDYKCSINDILSFYNLEPDMYEFSDTLMEIDGQAWKETLFLLGPEDSITFVYPERSKAS